MCQIQIWGALLVVCKFLWTIFSEKFPPYLDVWKLFWWCSTSVKCICIIWLRRREATFTYLSREPFRKGFMSLWLKSCENIHCFSRDSWDLIRSQFCTCHDSYAVVSCAKVLPNDFFFFFFRWHDFFFMSHEFLEDLDHYLIKPLWDWSQPWRLLNLFPPYCSLSVFQKYWITVSFRCHFHIWQVVMQLKFKGIDTWQLRMG